MNNLLFIIGTRPEAIKLAPLVIYLKRHYPALRVMVCLTAQHRDMLDDVLHFFSIKADYDLNLMKPNQQLSSLTAAILLKLDEVYESVNPDLVIVQGDTTTAMAGALAAFYRKISVAHVEAGLRSFELYEPFPEEINRRMIGQIAAYHFCPTSKAYSNLEKENLPGKKIVVGNTVIDALLLAKKIMSEKEGIYGEKFSFVQAHKRYILVTIHRRENFGEPLKAIGKSLEDMVAAYKNVEVVIPVHPNPNVKSFMEDTFSNNEKVHLLSALPYDELIWLMNKSFFVVTDSGGIQEEAPSLGKPVLVVRNVTERMEGVDAGTALLVGNEYDKLYAAMKLLLDSEAAYGAMSSVSNPYGDGESSKRICEILIPGSVEI